MGACVHLMLRWPAPAARPHLHENVQPGAQGGQIPLRQQPCTPGDALSKHRICSSVLSWRCGCGGSLGCMWLQSSRFQFVCAITRDATFRITVLAAGGHGVRPPHGALLLFCSVHSPRRSLCQSQCFFQLHHGVVHITDHAVELPVNLLIRNSSSPPFLSLSCVCIGLSIGKVVFQRRLQITATQCNLVVHATELAVPAIEDGESPVPKSSRSSCRRGQRILLAEPHRLGEEAGEFRRQQATEHLGSLEQHVRQFNCQQSHLRVLALERHRDGRVRRPHVVVVDLAHSLDVSQNIRVQAALALMCGSLHQILHPSLCIHIQRLSGQLRHV
mmetsp:Transcript_75/g.270  ORF Transcript_75/g.270 Transcript_75/m.270 type:complete len:330 (-) Transcript_75:345-1334(-)